ncbi:hypothetical protein AFK24_22560 [Pseudomonas syringae]|uniref:Uncharacterized protein n=1 Tax=Pseudomonas syringae TaxID=317 RepID=A0A1C7Z3R4_PSESX|nr:hypothetical protein [Pseudomonas syringae]OCR22815.1 hypothetical protein AFK24_22560 [Pseudomonas syringae]
MPLPDDPTPILLARFNQNINAIALAVGEVRMWIEHQGDQETSDSIRSYLAVLESNSDTIVAGMAELIQRWRPEEPKDPED